MKKEDIDNLEFIPDRKDILIKSIENEFSLPIYSIDNKTYIVLGRRYNDNIRLASGIMNNWSVQFENYNVVNHRNFIVDMNGIDNFITSKALDFHDYIVRKIILNHLKLYENQFYRFGVSGARSSDMHPGGEIVEEQELDYKNNIGIARSISGAIDLSTSEYSKARMLSEDGKNLKEERSVYSHTAWICKNNDNSPIFVYAKALSDNMSLLSMIHDLCSSYGINAVGVKISICGQNGIRIRGRVLKHVPEKKFQKLQEATDIASEKEYPLTEGSVMHLFGTLYKRYEPEWTLFTEGRQYEKRGHYHAYILGEENDNVHEVFHVRDICIDRDIELKLELFPMQDIYRIYPIHKIGERYFTDSANVEISQLYDSFKNFKVCIE